MMSVQDTRSSSRAGEEDLAAALAAARGGNRARAQELAWQSLRGNPQRVSCWLLLTSLVGSREDQEMCLRQVLAIEPEHELARVWFERVAQAEHLDALPFNYVVEDTAVPPPAAPSMGRMLTFDTKYETREITLPQSPAPAPARPRVLVVDDSATVRRLVTLTLERLGCEVVTASAGLEALGAMSHATPDLVLLDVGLPNLDGYQICRAIRRNDLLREIPVIMLTGRDGLMDRLRGKMAGATEYLSKPFDPQVLTAALHRYLPLEAQDAE